MKILYIYSNLTYPPKEGVHSQTLKTIQILRDLGHDVTVTGFCKNLDSLSMVDLSMDQGPGIFLEPTTYSGSVLSNAFKLKFSVRRYLDFHSSLPDSCHANYDAIIAEGLLAASTLKRDMKVKSIVNLIDSPSLRQFKLFSLYPNKPKYLLAGVFSRFLEAFLGFVSRAVIVVSPLDAKHLKRIIRGAEICSIPIVNEHDPKSSRKISSPDGLFKVLIWVDLNVEYLRESFTELADFIISTEQIFDRFEFVVLGRNLDSAFLEKYIQNARFVFVDWVENLDSFLQFFDLVVLPDKLGTGLKNRLLNCSANSVPIIATLAAAEGFTFQKDRDILIYDTYEEFSNYLLVAHNNISLRETLAANALAHSLSYYGFPNVSSKWSEILGRPHGKTV